MTGLDLTRLSPQELLKLYTAILDELKVRGVSRTLNNPVSEHAEWLVADRLDLKLVSNSTTG